jgi:hypothetical protein
MFLVRFWLRQDDDLEEATQKEGCAKNDESNDELWRMTRWRVCG